MQGNSQTSVESFVPFHRGKQELAPTSLIVQKDIELWEGMKVKVNWQEKKVSAEILALHGKLLIH